MWNSRDNSDAAGSHPLTDGKIARGREGLGAGDATLPILKMSKPPPLDYKCVQIPGNDADPRVCNSILQAADPVLSQ